MSEKDTKELFLSDGRRMLETGVFEITAEQQHLLIRVLIHHAREFGTEEIVIANEIFKTLLVDNPPTI